MPEDNYLLSRQRSPSAPLKAHSHRLPFRHAGCLRACVSDHVTDWTRHVNATHRMLRTECGRGAGKAAQGVARPRTWLVSRRPRASNAMHHMQLQNHRAWSQQTPIRPSGNSPVQGPDHERGPVKDASVTFSLTRKEGPHVRSRVVQGKKVGHKKIRHRARPKRALATAPLRTGADRPTPSGVGSSSLQECCETNTKCSITMVMLAMHREYACSDMELTRLCRHPRA